MLTGKRRVNKNKLLKNNSLEDKKIIIENYNDSIAKLKIEEEKMIRKNNDLSFSITEKNKRISEFLGIKKNIERIHSENVDIFKKELKDLKKKIEFNKNHLDTLERFIPIKELKEESLINSISELEDKKLKLQKEIKDIVENYNREKILADNRLLETLNKLAEAQNELSRLREDIESAKEVLNNFTEKAVIENKILSRRQKDLGIYEKRLRNRYPDKIINL